MIEKEISRTSDNNSVVEELQKALICFLKRKSHMTINALSKKCSVSEPTLRRIYKGQVKTIPSITTILDILSNISEGLTVQELISEYPGPLGDFLKKSLPDADVSIEYNTELNKLLTNSSYYIIYKLSSNSSGVKKDKIKEMFGEHGLGILKEFLLKGFIQERFKDTFFSVANNFHARPENFVNNFKALSDFIKVNKKASASGLNPIRVNFSESVNKETYKEIIKTQRQALKKIKNLMSSKNKKTEGDIPVFMLVAVDSLDTKTIDEIEEAHRLSKK